MADARDPLQADLDLTFSLYTQLAARVPPESHPGAGRRTPPASRPPLQVDMVSHMADLERYTSWWIATARYLLQPVTKVELTKREGVVCPYCGADLVAWLRSADPDASEIVCTGLDHLEVDGPRRWQSSEWKRLGVLAGVHDDARYGARPPWQKLDDAASG
jgi:hypothetical protein